MKRTAGALVRAPTDLGNFPGCRHLTGPDLRVARGEMKRPQRRSPFMDDLRARGLAHEKEYLDRLRAEGLTITGVDENEEGVSVYTARYPTGRQT